MTTLACDVSEFQTAVTNAYPHRWLTFRACDGSYLDKRAGRNLAWCVRARAAGKLDGFTVYVVYEPGRNDAILGILHQLDVPTDCVIMIDVESWGGKITGNRSPEINDLADRLAQRQGSKSRVWGYANRGDFANIWPHRPAWLGLVVASYGGSKPDSPGPGPLVGWQYTDGQYTVPGLPNASKPFGACDHNQLYLTEEDDMPLSKDDLDAIEARVRNQFEAFFVGDDGKPHQARTIVDQEITDHFDPAKLAAGIAAHLPAGSVTAAQIETAVRAAIDGATIQTGD